MNMCTTAATADYMHLNHHLRTGTCHSYGQSLRHFHADYDIARLSGVLQSQLVSLRALLQVSFQPVMVEPNTASREAASRASGWKTA